jgi:hypothetical protein
VCLLPNLVLWLRAVASVSRSHHAVSSVAKHSVDALIAPKRLTSSYHVIHHVCIGEVAPPRAFELPVSSSSTQQRDTV